MPMKYFESKTVGEVLSRITNDIDTLGQSLNQSVTQLITSVTTIIGVIIMMLSINTIMTGVTIVILPVSMDTLGQSLNQSVTQLITSVTTIIGVIIMMLSINTIMTGVTIVILPVSMALVMIVVKHSQKYFRAQQAFLGTINGQVEETYSGHNVVRAFNREQAVLDEFRVVKHSQKYFRAQQAFLGTINGQVEETYSGHNVVRAFNREQAVLDEFRETNKKLYQSAWKSQFFSGLMQPIMQFIGNLGYVAVAVLGAILAAAGTIQVGDIQSFIIMQFIGNLGYVAVAVLGAILAAAGTIQVGDIQSFIQYVRNFTQPITQMAQVSNMLQSMAAAAERVFEFLAEEEEDQLAESPVPASSIQGQVTFDHVRFGYDPNKIIIGDFSATVEPGQTVAIVGPTGAGKTTMVKLLMRFYDVQSGAIRIDGHDVRDFNRSELREAFGMVLQDTWLFKGTIMENIRYGRLDATDEEVIAAAKAAHVHHFIQTLPGGYQMELSEDASNISQGQRQLLTIARAILADNKIMILDEATSSVDTRTEQLIQKAMNNLMKGRTSFVIAHRLSTIKDADLILVMKDGDIIEQGNHQTLLEKNGFYATLYNSQFEDVSA